MKKFFTQVKFALVLALGLFTIQSQAQAVLNVDGIGSFQGSLANFGISNPCNLGVISGPIRIADDGTANSFACNAFMDSDLAGKIALVYRGGGCAFDLKALNAESNGALGVVICNNEPGRRPIGPDGANPVIVTIPTILLSLQDCFNLVNALEGGNEIAATIAHDDISLPASVNIVWGNQSGQGEFDGGLNGWTVENCSVDNAGTILDPNPVTWTWYENPIEERFSSQMISYSRCNGSVGFEATNWNIINGDLSNPNFYPNHTCELVSPIIDLSSAGPVSLQFWQVNFGLNGNDNPGAASMRVFVSIDGGMTYNEQIDVESGNLLTADQTIWANGELKRYFLPHLAGESNIRLKFEYYSDFYAWYVDDVYFIETPENSLTINTEVYGLPSAARTPVALVSPLLSIGEVSNTGLATQSATRIDLSIVGPTSFSTTIQLGDLQSDSTNFDCSTPDLFTATEVGIYSVNMTAASDSMDFDLTDNSLDFGFEVTDSIWSKDAGEVNGLIRPASANNFIWGPVFSVPDDYTGTDMIEGLEFGFELADSLDGSDQFLTWQIIEWDDENGDATCQASERIDLEAGFVEFTYRDGVDGEMTTYNLTELVENNPIAIEAGKKYIIAVTWNNPDREVSIYGYNGYDYLGMRVAYEQCSAFTRFNDVIGVGDADIAGDWSTGGWASGVVPAMRLITKPIVRVNEINQNFSLDLFPNPTQDQVNVKVEFEDVVKNLSISLTDITGRVITTENHTKVISRTFSFDLANYSNGVYFAKITTDEGIATKRFVVSK